MTGLITLLLVLGLVPVSDFHGAAYSNAARWVEKDQPDVRALMAPPGRSGEFAMVMITAPRPAGRDSIAQLQAFADEAEKLGRRLERGTIERNAVGPYTMLVMPSKVELPGLGTHTRIYELVTDGQRTVLANGFFRGEAAGANVVAMMQILASVRPGATREAPPRGEAPPPPPTGGQGIPYGPSKAPVLDAKFRPSGHGVPIPPATIAGGMPRGLWWNVHAPTGSIYPTVFLADGTVARFYRPGGPMLADLEGMRELGDGPYIGRAHVSGGVLTAAYGEYVVSTPIVVRNSSEGPYFLWNHDEHHPAIPLTREFLVGTWRLGAMGTFTFRPDGTVLTTPPMIEAQWAHKSGEQLVGTWTLEGYLLALPVPGRRSPCLLGVPGDERSTRRSPEPVDARALSLASTKGARKRHLRTTTLATANRSA